MEETRESRKNGSDPSRGKSDEEKKAPGPSSCSQVLKAGRNCSFLPATGGAPGGRACRGDERRGARGGSGTTKPRDARRWRATRSRTPRSRVRAGRPGPLPRRAHARGRAHLDDAELVEARPEIRVEDVLHRLRARPRRDGIVRQRHHGRRDAGSRGERARVEQCAPSGSRRAALRFLGRKYPEFPAPGAEAEISLEPCHVVEGEEDSQFASRVDARVPSTMSAPLRRAAALGVRAAFGPSSVAAPVAWRPAAAVAPAFGGARLPPSPATCRDVPREHRSRPVPPAPRRRPFADDETARPADAPPPPSHRSRAQPTAGSRTNPTTTSSRCVPPPRDASGLRRFVR